MPSSHKRRIGTWTPGGDGQATVHDSLDAALPQLERPLFVLDDGVVQRYACGGALGSDGENTPVMAFAPACPPAQLGDRAFCEAHGLAYPCYGGSMAHGIASEDMVYAMGAAGMLGFFGSAGLSPEALCDVLERLPKRMGTLPFGINLINSPGNSEWERDAVELFLKYDIRLVEASAYIIPTAALVKYRVKGLRQGPEGTVIAPNKVIAKVSRNEIAKRFLEPPSQRLLDKLLAAEEITGDEARLARGIPLAQDITAEADSGGHTDHRSALALLPGLLRLRDEIQDSYGYAEVPRIGLAGGIGTPESAAAAFAMGAAYIVTGSINQSCVESGASAAAREMLAGAAQTDVADAPAADMFEMGVTVQVLKRGTRFAERAAKLYDLYRRYNDIGQIPPEERQKIECTIFKATLDDVWEETRAFFARHNPTMVEKAERDPKKKMALIFRWYLGKAVHWANHGDAARREDYQLWCGPAMGAFNDWVRGSFLEAPENRKVAVAAHQLLYGAALRLRMQTLRAQGVAAPLDNAWKMPQPTLLQENGMPPYNKDPL